MADARVRSNQFGKLHTFSGEAGLTNQSFPSLDGTWVVNVEETQSRYEIIVDKYWPKSESNNNNKVVHAKMKFRVKNDSDTIDGVYVYDDHIKIMVTENGQKSSYIYKLPNIAVDGALNEFRQTENCWLEVTGNDNENPSLDFPNTNYSEDDPARHETAIKIVAKGDEVFCESQEQTKLVLSTTNNLKIKALVNNAIIFEDGSVSTYSFDNPSALSKHRRDLDNLLKDKIKIERDTFSKLIDDIDENETTPDGHNIKQVFLEIHSYLDSNPFMTLGNDGKSSPLEHLHTYQSLNEMLRYRHNPQEVTAIACARVEATAPSSRSVRSLVAGVILAIAAAALIGLAIASFTILLPFTCGFSFGIGVVSILGAAVLLPLAAMKFSNAQYEGKHRKNVNAAMSIFKTEPDSKPKEENKAPDNQALDKNNPSIN